MLWFALISIPYVVFILTAWFNLVKNPKGKKPALINIEVFPTISVIVAAKNEEENLPSLIKDLLSIRYPEDKMEIIIVDDNSSDNTSQILRKTDRILGLLSPGKGKKQAIAYALEHSSGELVLTTDADCRIPADWLHHHASAYVHDKADLIIGQVDPISRPGLTGRFQSLEYYALQAISGGMALSGRAIMCNGANLGFRRSNIENYSDSVRDEIISGDDMFLLHSVKNMGGKITWLGDNSSSVQTRLPEYLSKFFNQRRRWASKSKFYMDVETIFSGLATLIVNLSIILFLVLSIFNPGLLLVGLIIYLSKLIPELLLLTNYLRRKNLIRLIVWFIPASIIYPFYTSIVFLLSLFPKKTW